MNEAGARVVVVDDEPNIRRLLAGVLSDEGHECATVGSVEDLRAALREEPADLVLLDVCLPGEDGMQWLTQHVRGDRADVGAVIMMSGHGTIDLALKAVRLGAVDFLEKPIAGDRLLLSVENALALSTLRRENERLRGGRATAALLGESRAMLALRAAIERAAPTDATVLVSGENGTGKELVAAALHEASKRSRGPYVQLNCAAIPATLLESELFGHEVGAFTGARRTHRGHFERAHRGTLLLDEIGDMPLELQAKLLRVLEDGRVTRLGAETARRVDVRLVASTHRDLRRRVDEGAFREDLYYRLAVLEVHVPALRERDDDVDRLARHFLDHFGREFGRPVPALTDEALAVLRAHPWPGNVRELRNAMARVVALTDSSEVAASTLRSVLSPAPTRPGIEEVELPTLQEELERTERALIERALTAHGGNKAAAARALGIDRANLHRKMKRLRMERS